jgi:Iap family predicted aminopeptidase
MSAESPDSLERAFKERAVVLMRGMGIPNVTVESLTANEVHRAQFRALLVDAVTRAAGVYRDTMERLVAEIDAMPSRERDREERQLAMKIRAEGTSFTVPERNPFDEAIEQLKEPPEPGSNG